MALLWFDPICYATADLTKMGYGLDTATCRVIAGGGYKSGNALSGAASLGNYTLSRITGSAGTGFIFSMYLYNDWSGITSATNLLAFYNSASLECAIQIDWASGSLTALRGSTNLANGTVAVPKNAWSLIEVKVSLADSGGVLEVLVDGATSISFTGDTKNTAAGVPADISSIQIGFKSSATTASKISVPTLISTTGAAPTSYLHNTRVGLLAANANGANSAWVNEAGNSTNLYQSIDDTTPDGSTYIQSATVGNKATFGFSDLTGTPATVHAVGLFPVVQTDDGGAKSFANMLVISGTDYVQATQTAPSAPIYKPNYLVNNPATAAAWTVSNVNALEAGVKVIA